MRDGIDSECRYWIGKGGVNQIVNGCQVIRVVVVYVLDFVYLYDIFSVIMKGLSIVVRFDNFVVGIVRKEE